MTPAAMVAIGLMIVVSVSATAGSHPAAMSLVVLIGVALVLITIDTLRADYVGCYGSKLARTPTLDRIAAELIEKETLDAAEVAEIFSDVPKWEHTETGAFRIWAPEARALVEGGRVASTHSDEQAPVQG